MTIQLPATATDPENQTSLGKSQLKPSKSPKTIKKIRWLLPVLFLSCHSFLWAGNAVSTAKVSLHPTFECMGVEVRHQGDDNNDSSGEVFYRVKGASQWNQGHPLVLVGDKPVKPKGRIINPRFYTSLFCLKEDTAYEIKVEMKDPDGVSEQPEIATATTRSSRVPTGSEKHFYIKPGMSLENAIKQGGPGDTIHLAKGTYFFQGYFKSTAGGNEKAWLHILGEPGAVITDADPACSGVGKLAWEKFEKDEEGRQIYKLPVKDAHRVLVRKTPGDITTDYFLWRFTDDPKEKFGGPHRGITLQDMIENYTGMNDLGVSLQQPDALYLILPKGMDDPAQVDLQISRQPKGDARYSPNQLEFQGSHILIEGVTFEHSMRISAKSHLILRNIRGYLCDPRIGLGSDALVEDSIFVFNSGPDWNLAPPAKMTRGNEFWDSWHRLKNGRNDTHLMTPGKSSTIRYNFISGYGNVIGYPLFNENFNIDVYGNRIEKAGDDCVEPDGTGVNWRIYHNHFRDFLNGVSDAPVSRGPFFVVRNIFQDYIQAPFKCRNGARGKTFYYHNVTCPQKDPMVFAGFSKNPPPPTTWPIPESEQEYNGTAYAPDKGGDWWMRTRNNVLIGGKQPYRLKEGGKNLALETLDFDYDALGTMTDCKDFNKHGGQHAVMLESTFTLGGFINYQAGDLRAAPSVAASLIDAGEIVKGINDGGSGEWQYQGKGPDIGLVENGAPLPHFGPRTPNATVKEAK